MSDELVGLVGSLGGSGGPSGSSESGGLDESAWLGKFGYFWVISGYLISSKIISKWK